MSSSVHHRRPASLASVACVLCKKRKRKCDGQKPCSTCKKYNNASNCEYPVDKDRRKWKHDSSYVDYLEVKLDLLEQFFNELNKSNPEKASFVREKLKIELPLMPAVASSTNPKLMQMANPKALDEFLSTAWRVRQYVQGGRTEFYGPISGRQQVLEEEELESSATPKDGKIDIILTSKGFRNELFDIFERNFSNFFYISSLTLPEIRNWDFPNKEANKQFLLCAIFAYASVYTNMKHVSSSFVLEAESVALAACRYSLDESTLQGLLILSCFELGMAYDSASWLFNAMCASQTQYLGLHLGDCATPFGAAIRQQQQSELVSRSPLKSAAFWSIVMQDRLITSFLGRGCRIQYFRILAPFYSPVIFNKSNPNYLSELVFTYHSRLWYIHDRSISQIYSFKARFLHNSHRMALLQQGVSSLKILYQSFPEDIKLNWNFLDSRVLMLHLSYYVVLLLLHRPYLSSFPEKFMEISIEQCVNASKVVDAYNKEYGFNNAPYFASYLILSCAMFDLFILANKDESLKPEAYRRMDIFITALLQFGKVWKRGYKDIHVLSVLADKWSVHYPFLKETSHLCDTQSFENFSNNNQFHTEFSSHMDNDVSDIEKQYENMHYFKEKMFDFDGDNMMDNSWV